MNITYRLVMGLYYIVQVEERYPLHENWCKHPRECDRIGDIHHWRGALRTVCTGGVFHHGFSRGQ